MFITCALLTVIFSLFILNSVLLKWPNPRAFYYLSKIHGLQGWPIFGSAIPLMRLEEEEILPFFRNLLDKYPRLTSMSICGIPAVYFQKPEDIKHLVSSIDNINKGMQYRPLDSWMKTGLLTSSGDKWKSRRKLLTPAFHFRILEDSLAGMNSNARLLVKKLSMTNEKVRVDEAISNCTLNVITESAMGINLQSNSEDRVRYVENVKWLTKQTMYRIINALEYAEFPFTWLPKGRKYGRTLKEMHAFTDKVIEERKKSFMLRQDSTNSRKKRLVFLDCLLEMEQSNPGSLANGGIREEVDTFMFEGHDTTSSALQFVLHCVGEHENIQENLRLEMEDIFEGSDRDVTLSDTTKMAYLEKVIKETLRIYPAVSTFTRTTTKDIVLDDGVMIAAGTDVLIPVFHLHMDPELYPDPHRFDPERFSEDQVAARHPFAYLPFSAGPRNCIGQKFAMLELKVVLSHLIRNLRIKSLTRKEEIKLVPRLIMWNKTPLQFKFEKLKVK